MYAHMNSPTSQNPSTYQPAIMHWIHLQRITTAHSGYYKTSIFPQGSQGV